MKSFEKEVAAVHRKRIRITLYKYSGVIAMSAFVLTGVGMLYGLWLLGA